MQVTVTVDAEVPVINRLDRTHSLWKVGRATPNTLQTALSAGSLQRDLLISWSLSFRLPQDATSGPSITKRQSEKKDASLRPNRPSDKSFSTFTPPEQGRSHIRQHLDKVLTFKPSSL